MYDQLAGPQSAQEGPLQACAYGISGLTRARPGRLLSLCQQASLEDKECSKVAVQDYSLGPTRSHKVGLGCLRMFADVTPASAACILQLGLRYRRGSLVKGSSQAGVSEQQLSV